MDLTMPDVSSSKFGSYVPMKVPDKITLVDQGIHHTELSTGSSDIRSRESIPRSSAIPGNKSDSSDQFQLSAAAAIDTQTPSTDLAQRVEQLEHKLQDIEDRLTRVGMSPVTSRFWYVITFSSWMMLPLIMAFFFYHRRYHSN